jgi:ATP/maltotriose-dependent transcriptional regulator MalT
VCASCFGAQVYWLLGYPERGLALSRAALALAERIAHPFSLLEALLFNAMLHIDRGEPEMALQRLDAAEALAAEQRLSFQFEPRLLRGEALIAQGAFVDAVTYLRQGHEARRVNQSRPLGFALLRRARGGSRDGEGWAESAARDRARPMERGASSL